MVMKKIMKWILIFFLAGLTEGGEERYRVQAEDTIRETLSFIDSAKRGEVRVDNIFGSISVTGTNRHDVAMLAHQTIKAVSQEKVVQARKEVKLDIYREENLIDIYVDGPFREERARRRDPGYRVHYDFEIQVPRETELSLKTVNNGDIRVESVQGKFEIHNVNGEISLKAIGGGGTAHTVNGEVTAQFIIHPEHDCSLHTINGDIKTTFPRNLSADFRLKTFNGDAYSDFPYTSLPADAPEIRRKDGKFIYKSSRFSKIRIGKGGPKINMDTLNGDLLINQR